MLRRTVESSLWITCIRAQCKIKEICIPVHEKGPKYGRQLSKLVPVHEMGCFCGWDGSKHAKPFGKFVFGNRGGEVLVSALLTEDFFMDSRSALEYLLCRAGKSVETQVSVSESSEYLSVFFGRFRDQFICKGFQSDTL